MPPAAVSYPIKSHEERVGAALFVRERGRARLTPLGQRLLAPLTRGFDAIEAAFAAVRQEDEALLTISTTTTFANTWLAWRLGAFQLAHPDLAVRLETSGALADLVAGDADAAIRAGPGAWPGIETIKLMDLDFTPMCSPSFLRRVEGELGRPIEPADLLSLPLMNPADEWWDQWFTDAGVDITGRPRPRGGLRLDSQANEGHAAMGGQGFVLLTPMFWANDMADGRLVQPFATRSTRGFAYWLAYAEGRRQVPKIKRFREWLLGAIGENGAMAPRP